MLLNRSAAIPAPTIKIMIRTTNSRRPLAKQTVHSCIAVVGLPSHELLQRATRDEASSSDVRGVGKSCLSSRFVLPSHDDYAASEENHPSSVSVAEFAAHEVNRAHYHYFGTVVKLVDTRSVVFHVVEHTTFTDSATGQVHPGGEEYEERATAKSLRSANKVSYIGGKYRGVAPQAREKFPKRFTKRSGPGGGVRGHVLVLDPTVPEELVKAQVDLLGGIAERLGTRARTPFVVALSKCDACDIHHKEVVLNLLREHEALAEATVFETSARTGVGVEEAFIHLHHLIAARRNSHANLADLPDSPCAESSWLCVPFDSASDAQALARKTAYSGVGGLFESTALDANQPWPAYLECVGQNENLAALMSLAGRKFCRALYKKHIVELKAKELRDGQGKGLSEETVNEQLVLFCDSHPDFAQDKPIDLALLR